MGKHSSQAARDQDAERQREDAREERDRLRREVRIRAALVEHDRLLREEMALLDARLERAKANVRRED